MASSGATDADTTDELTPVAIIRDPQTALAALRPPRPAILAALRQPYSASSLAPRLNLPRQKVYYHLQDLEKAGLVKLVEQRRRRGFTERVVQATAQRYLLSPEILGALPSVQASDTGHHVRFGWPWLAAIAGCTIQDLAGLTERLGDEAPALSIPTRVRFGSPKALEEFFRELTDELTRLATKYHDDSADAAEHQFFLGAYPVVSDDSPPMTPGDR